MLTYMNNSIFKNEHYPRLINAVKNVVHCWFMIPNAVYIYMNEMTLQVALESISVCKVGITAIHVNSHANLA